MKLYAFSEARENQMFAERLKLEQKVDMCVRCFKFWSNFGIFYFKSCQYSSNVFSFMFIQIALDFI